MANDSHNPEHHGGATVNVYLVVFLALCIFTALSFVVNLAEHTMGFGVLLGMAIILIVAVCKATLVAMYFMHVKWDWGKLFFIIIPVCILAVLMMVVLLPDMVVAWHHDVIE
jgi:caa(3)-type oxidase subunit IV